MTVTSKHLARQGSTQCTRAKIVSLPATRSVSARKFIRSEALSGTSANRRPPTAELYSVRQHLTSVASIGLNDTLILEKNCSAEIVEKLLLDVRALLDNEFGQLRVHRRHQSFLISHYCMESLLAGLLRVQYHSRQIMLAFTASASADDAPGELSNVSYLSWGVGKTRAEAEGERHRRNRRF